MPLTCHATAGQAAAGALQLVVPPLPPPCLTACALPASPRRHFAERQFRSDQFGTSLGSLIYLSLIPSLVQLGRRDLAAAAIGCSLMSGLWPLCMARFARNLYATRRDYLFFLQ